MDLVSKKTRSEFQEYLVSYTLREIERYFDNHDITLVELNEEQLPSGMRRAHVAKYYAGIDWKNPRDVKKVLLVYEDILSDLNTDMNSNEEFKQSWTQKLTKCLQKDGYIFNGSKIYIHDHIAFFENLENATSLLDKGHFQEYTERIKKSIDSDPVLAIGSTKELVESTLKTILKELGEPTTKDDDIPKLLKHTQKQLDLVPDSVDDSKKGAEIIKILLSNLGQIVIKLAELRNLYGTGHGKDKIRKGLSPRHARLAVGAGITLCTFLLETFELKRK